MAYAGRHVPWVSAPGENHARYVQPACLRPGGAGNGAYARSQHDLPRLALDLAGAARRTRVAGRRGARLRVLHAVRGIGHHRAGHGRALCLRCAARGRRDLSALSGVAGGQAGRAFAVPGARTAAGWSGQAVRDGLPDQPAEPQDRGDVSVAVAAVHPARAGQRADAVVHAGRDADRDQHERQRHGGHHGRFDRGLPGAPPAVAGRAAVADGHGAGGAGRTHGHRGAPPAATCPAASARRPDSPPAHPVRPASPRRRRCAAHCRPATGPWSVPGPASRTAADRHRS